MSASLPSELCPRQSISQAAQLIVAAVHGLEPYRLSTIRAAADDNAASISRQENVISLLKAEHGHNSMANLFSRARLAERSMYFWVSYEQAANQAKQSAGELEKNVQGLSRSLPSSQLSLTLSGNILCT